MFKQTEETRKFVLMGNISKIGTTEFAILHVLEAYDGDPITQQEVAELVGVSRPTANKALANLITQQFIKKVGDYKPVRYAWADAVFDFSDKVWTAKDFIIRYCELFKETYGVQFNPTWGRATSMVKTKLIGKFTDEQLEMMLVTGFKEYDRRWSKPAFPRPTIGAFCTWLGNEALAIATKDQLEEKRFEEASTVDLDKYAQNMSF